MGTHRLVPHPDSPPNAVDGVEVRWFETGGALILRYQVKGAQSLSVPPFAGKGRGDGLWRTTCCELFLRGASGTDYTEFNFSPSERWAAYGFADYRREMADAEVPPPDISAAVGDYLFVLTAVLDAVVLSAASAAALSAVIEERDGTISYWALAHPEGKPDFHHPACFALALPAASGA